MQQNALAKLACGCIVSASRCGWQQQLHILSVPHASLGFAASVSTTTTLRDADGHNHGELTASTSAAQAPLHKPSHRAPKVPGLAVPTKLAGIEYQPALLPSGSRAADPGEPKYTAPYWVPQEARQRLGLPNVLFVEPWRAAEDPALRRMHAQLCMEYLQAAGKPLSAENIFHGVNQQHGAVFALPGYVRTLMEHLRKERFVYGR